MHIVHYLWNKPICCVRNEYIWVVYVVISISGGLCDNRRTDKGISLSSSSSLLHPPRALRGRQSQELWWIDKAHKWNQLLITWYDKLAVWGWGCFNDKKPVSKMFSRGKRDYFIILWNSLILASLIIQLSTRGCSGVFPPLAVVEAIIKLKWDSY